MNAITKAAIEADESIPHAQRDAALAALSGPPPAKPLDRVLKAREAARLLGVTTRTIRNWSAAGWLRPVYVGGGGPAIGYALSSVTAIIEGRTDTGDEPAGVSA